MIMGNKVRKRIIKIGYRPTKNDVIESKLEIRERCIKVAIISFIISCVCAVWGYTLMHAESSNIRARVDNAALGMILFLIASLAFFTGVYYAIEAYVHGERGTSAVPPIFLLGIKEDQHALNQKERTQEGVAPRQTTRSKNKRLQKIEQKLEKIRQWPYDTEEQERLNETQNDNNFGH